MPKIHYIEKSKYITMKKIQLHSLKIHSSNSHKNKDGKLLIFHPTGFHRLQNILLGISSSILRHPINPKVTDE